MNDVFLVLAQADEGVTCFVVPRVLPDGTRNPLDVVRLKDKLGNRSNASSELELDGTVARRLGDEGRGVRTIIEMVAATRLDCVLGSAGLMRRAVAEASWHVAHRSAFGSLLADKPLMQQRGRRPRRRVRGRDRARDPAGRGRRRGPTTRTRPPCAGSPCRWRSSGSASARRAWWPRRWSASAATATSRTPACRCSTARRRSTRSGRARATSTRSTCCARSRASPRRSRPGSPRSAGPAAPTAARPGRRRHPRPARRARGPRRARGRRPAAGRPDGRLPAGLAARALRPGRGRRRVLRLAPRHVVRRDLRHAVGGDLRAIVERTTPTF